MPQADADRVIRHFVAVGLPTKLSDIPGQLPDAERLMELVAQDKKVKRGKLTFILSRGIGQAFVASDVDAADARAFLAGQLS